MDLNALLRTLSAFEMKMYVAELKAAGSQQEALKALVSALLYRALEGKLSLREHRAWLEAIDAYYGRYLELRDLILSKL